MFNVNIFAGLLCYIALMTRAFTVDIQSAINGSQANLSSLVIFPTEGSAKNNSVGNSTRQNGENGYFGFLFGQRPRPTYEDILNVNRTAKVNGTTVPMDSEEYGNNSTGSDLEDATIQDSLEGGIESRAGSDKRVRVKVQIPKKECELDTKDDLPKENDPLYLNEKGVPLSPVSKYNRSILSPPKSGNMLLVCGGAGNYLLTGGKQISQAKCENGLGYSVEGRNVNLKTVTCKSSNKAVIRDSKEKCGSDLEGVIYSIGFQVDKSWIPVMTACHDIERANTLYVDHTIDKLTAVGAVSKNPRVPFKEGHNTLYKGLKVNDLYKKNTQKELLLNVLGRDDLYTDKDKYLSRGHLAADADYIYSSYQQATYFYINVAPQWYTVNAGNWLSIERRVRQIASKRQGHASIRTGTQGILKLRDTSEIPRMLFLDRGNDRIPVPAFFWKAVTVGNEGIVFVVSNNPFTPPERIPCKDICSSVGWRFSREIENGRVYCCTFQDAARIILDLPQVPVKSILSWP